MLFLFHYWPTSRGPLNGVSPFTGNILLSSFRPRLRPKLYTNMLFSSMQPVVHEVHIISGKSGKLQTLKAFIPDIESQGILQTY